MPILVRDLLEDRKETVTVNSDDKISKAIDLMVRNDYSALPVVDEEQIIQGLISSDSILKTIQLVQMLPNELTVRPAMETRPNIVDVEEEMSDILKALQTTQCVLVGEGKKPHQKLRGIITSWDTSEYYRQRSEDFMYINDIESALKKHIENAFATDNDGDDRLNDAIIRVTSSQDTDLVYKATSLYFEKSKSEQKKPNDEIVKLVLAEIQRKYESKRLDELTLSELIELLFHKDTWAKCSSKFSIPNKNLRKLLNRVREIRNELAHFKREELTREERDTVLYCSRFLQELHPHNTPLYDFVEFENLEDNEPPTNDEGETSKGKYSPLAQYLVKQSAQTDELTLEFSNIEKIINSQLPESARKHGSWWANDSVGHVQSKQWLNAGWKVVAVNIPQERVTFVRESKKRQKYIAFFNRLVDKLKNNGDFDVNINPRGTSWHVLGHFYDADNNNSVAALSFGFTLTDQAQINLYIDAKSKDQNKKIFDDLSRNCKDNIEDAIRQLSEKEKISMQPIRWERNDSKRASKVAIYHPGSIDNDDSLETLIMWGEIAAQIFKQVIEKEMKKLGYEYRT